MCPVSSEAACCQTACLLTRQGQRICRRSTAVQASRRSGTDTDESAEDAAAPEPSSGLRSPSCYRWLQVTQLATGWPVVVVFALAVQRWRNAGCCVRACQLYPARYSKVTQACMRDLLSAHSLPAVLHTGQAPVCGRVNGPARKTSCLSLTTCCAARRTSARLWACTCLSKATTLSTSHSPTEPGQRPATTSAPCRATQSDPMRCAFAGH